jgi:hypothetical protein
VLIKGTRISVCNRLSHAEKQTGRSVSHATDGHNSRPEKTRFPEPLQIIPLTPSSWALIKRPPAVQLLKNLLAFSLPRSQEPCTAPYSEPDQFSPCHPILSKIHFDRAVAQAVSRQLPSEAARVRAHGWSCGNSDGQNGTGAGFLRVLGIHLPSIAPVDPLLSSFIIRRWRNRPAVDSVPPPPSSPKNKIHLISTHLRLDLSSGLFPPGFANKNLYATCATHLMQILTSVNRRRKRIASG